MTLPARHKGDNIHESGYNSLTDEYTQRIPYKELGEPSQAGLLATKLDKGTLNIVIHAANKMQTTRSQSNAGEYHVDIKSA